MYKKYNLRDCTTHLVKRNKCGRQAAGGNRSAHVCTLEELDDMIDEGTSRIKSYIQDKWTNKETGVAQYSRYGMTRRNRNYELPPRPPAVPQGPQPLRGSHQRRRLRGQRQGKDFLDGHPQPV